MSAKHNIKVHLPKGTETNDGESPDKTEGDRFDREPLELDRDWSSVTGGRVVEAAKSPANDK